MTYSLHSADYISSLKCLEMERNCSWTMSICPLSCLFCNGEGITSGSTYVLQFIK